MPGLPSAGEWQIAYSFLFRLCMGEVFGISTPVNLILVEIPQAVDKLSGVVFELQDCASPCLGEVKCTSNVEEAFVNADWIVLLGAFPRGPGMDRSQLLAKNAPIFKSQGEVSLIVGELLMHNPYSSPIPLFTK